MNTIEASPARSRAAPLRSLFEIAVLAAYLVALPPALESALMQAGYATTGLTRIVFTGALFLGIVALVVILLALRGETLRDIGLRRPGNVAMTLVIGVALAALMFAALEGLKRVGLMDETRLGDMASELKGDLALTLMRFALSLLVVGFVEELLFRGFVMDRIAKALGGGVPAFALAIPGQAVLFGLSHAYQGMQGVTFTSGVGLVFGIVVVAARRNLWPVIVAHCIFDAGRAAYLYFLLTNAA